jgi:hypothetical protein
MTNSTIIETWQKIKTLVESMDIDVQKSRGGNASAGIRARRGLRLLKKEASFLVKCMVESDKASKASEASG